MTAERTKSVTEAAQNWIQEADYIPNDINYDWLPLCEALVEPFRDVSSGFLPSMEDDEDDDNKTPPKRHRVLREVTALDTAPDMVPTKDPNSGAWDHVRYLPSWMDPDFRETLQVDPDGNMFQITLRDSVYNLRPALRLEDVIRNPTGYAQRFGIAADRLDGRSRTSPTWSKTRDPFDDFANQINQLSSTESIEAERLSLQLYQKSGKTPPAGQAILPEVMQKLLSRHGILTNAELVAELEGAVTKGMALDQLVDDLKKRNPRIREAHRVWLDNAQQDQDYQRILFNGMTTDELIQDNIHTMANDFQMELDGPVIFLFDRDRWENSKWKGKHPWAPKNLYNINGTREEWDVATNDTLWDAMQPALRLVSKVLDTSHPHLEAVYNLCTRQLIPYDEDGRENPSTPNLIKYVLEDEIDLSLTHKGLRDLCEIHDYDWKANILRVLNEYLVIDIGSCYSQTGFSDEYRNGVKQSTMTSGWTTMTPRKDRRQNIVINIGAEEIWPLLVPQYSNSEKMICSFNLASTLLHEFTHAIWFAQHSLTAFNYLQPPGQDPEITKLLRSLEHELWDLDQNGEAYFQDAPEAEPGFEFENALWGFVPHNMAGDYVHGPVSKHLEAPTWGCLAMPLPLHGIGGDDVRLGTMRPIVVHLRPIPLEFVAKLFTKRFWEEDFVIYGHSALQKMPEGRIQKSLMIPWYPFTEDSLAQRIFGPDRWKFLNAVSRILKKGRQHVLSCYLQAVADESMILSHLNRRWTQEAKRWVRGVIHPLRDSINTLLAEIQYCHEINSQRNADDAGKFQFYTQYVNSLDPQEQTLSFDEWKTWVESVWVDEFREGGRLLDRLLIVHNYMQIELGALQQIIFEFLSLDRQTQRPNLYTGTPEDTGPIGLVYARLTSFRLNAELIATTVDKIAVLPALVHIQDRWEEWRKRFDSNRQQYRDLQKAIEQADQLDPQDNSWKTRFRKLPTANWKRLSQRYEKLAVREYNRVPFSVRQVVDQFLVEVKYARRVPVQSLQSQAEIDDILELFNSLPDYNRFTKQATSLMPTIFDFTVPAVPSTTGQVPPPPVNVTATQPPRLAPIPDGATIGVPGLRNSCPRRIPLGTNPRLQGSGFGAYTTNNLSASLVSQTAPWVSQTQVPPQNTMPGAFGPTGRILPFPSAYANRIVTTSEVRAFAEERRLRDQTAQSTRNASGTYRTPRLWRETNRRIRSRSPTRSP